MKIYERHEQLNRWCDYSPTFTGRDKDFDAELLANPMDVYEYLIFFVICEPWLLKIVELSRTVGNPLEVAWNSAGWGDRSYVCEAVRKLGYYAATSYSWDKLKEALDRIEGKYTYHFDGNYWKWDWV